MTDNELLLAISSIVEKKIRAEVEPIKIDMKTMEAGIRQDMKTMEAGIRQDMKTMEAGIRQDMKTMEAGIRQDMKTMETGIRQDMKAMEARLDQRISNVESRLCDVEVHLEQVTDKNIQLLAETCAPAAKRFEKASEKMESMQSDIDIMKEVLKEHSKKLQMIS